MTVSVGISNTLRDENGHPLSGASVFVYDTAGALASTGGPNPVTTDATGTWTATLANGTYELVYLKGGRYVTRTIEVCADDDNGNVRERTVLDQRYQPLPGALVWVRQAGALVDLPNGNPLVTDSLGRWTADLAVGTYDLTITKGDATLTRTLMVCSLIDTFYLLAEDGARLTAENGDRLLWRAP